MPYGSRTRTCTKEETNYAQTEQKRLATVFHFDPLSQLNCGRLVTDHIPSVAINMETLTDQTFFAHAGREY